MRDKLRIMPIDRISIDFMGSAERAFSFLYRFGFTKTEALPTLVRYKKGDIEIDIYHGRSSYEIGAGITSGGVRYTMSELIRACDAVAAAGYRDAIATTPEEVASFLLKLGELMKRYGMKALNGEKLFFLGLEQQRKSWSEEYALEVLTEQLRPQATEAFKRGDYATAARLYSRIAGKLTPSEAKKLAFAIGKQKAP